MAAPAGVLESTPTASEDEDETLRQVRLFRHMHAAAIHIQRLARGHSCRCLRKELKLQLLKKEEEEFEELRKAEAALAARAAPPAETLLGQVRAGDDLEL